jgi:hypothetical protein
MKRAIGAERAACTPELSILEKYNTYNSRNAYTGSLPFVKRTLEE